MAEEAPKQVDVLEVVEDEKKNTTTYTSLSTDSTTIEDYSSPKKEEEDDDEEEEEEVTSGVKFGGNSNNATDEICTENDGNNKELFPDNEMKALVELKLLIRTAINNNEFTCSPSPPSSESVVKQQQTTTAETLQESSAAETLQELSAESSRLVVTEQQDVKTIMCECDDAHKLLTPLSEEGVSIWGVPLFKDQRTDTVLWKFLRARDFKVQDAFTMFKSTIKWRKEFKIDELVSEEDELCKDLEKAVFMHGVSKKGHPVCYNVYGAFENKELYQKTFSDEEKRQRFLKWRIQVLEKSIRKLDFWGEGGVCTIVQVNDLKNSPGPGKWELRQATKQALHLLQDNYPEFVAKQVFINVPWWYVAVNKMISHFLTQRTKSKFVVAGPSKSAETLFSYIAPEQVPVQYGGFSEQGELGTKDGVTQIFVKPNSKETVEFAVTEACHLTWEMRVLGWEVSYSAEFVPNAKDAYTVIIQKMRKVGATEETVISNTFKTSERGKVVLTIDNSSSKKKRLLYRIKSHPSYP